MTTKKTTEKSTTKKVTVVKGQDCTYIDRSNGTLLREKDLNKKKPWISPISGQATIEKLTERELFELKQA